MKPPFLLPVFTGLVFASAVATEPASAVPLQNIEAARRAKGSFERGDYPEAERIYQSILAQFPNNLYVLSNLGVTRFRAGKLKLAEDAFLRAIAVAPADDFSQCMLGIVYYSQARYDDAVNAFIKALAINPKNASAHRYLSLIAIEKSSHDAAKKELDATETLNPYFETAPNLGDFLTPLEKINFQAPSIKK
jgi:tetratricopeptide (TPR) repeat protein